MAEFDKIIKAGTIVDGTLTPPYKADVGIKDGRIAKIGHLKSSDASKKACSRRARDDIRPAAQ
jgi:N-acyl-D-aspartate/D-glutamate deacylase